MRVAKTLHKMSRYIRTTEIPTIEINNKTSVSINKVCRFIELQYRWMMRYQSIRCYSTVCQTLAIIPEHYKSTRYEFLVKMFMTRSTKTTPPNSSITHNQIQRPHCCSTVNQSSVNQSSAIHSLSVTHVGKPSFSISLILQIAHSDARPFVILSHQLFVHSFIS